jgi:hypothetical protein
MGNANSTFPFFYIQLAAWPTGITATGSGASLPVFRVAAEQTLVDKRVCFRQRCFLYNILFQLFLLSMAIFSLETSIYIY